MVRRVVDQVQQAGLSRVYLVVGHQSEQVMEAVPDIPCVIQEEQLGTGHAVDKCRGVLEEFEGAVLVTYGDTPLFRWETFSKALDYYGEQQAAAAIITAFMDDPTGYGRILRDEEGRVRGIVEESDASEEERGIKEINTGTYCFDSAKLFSYLERVGADNVQGEYYLPDVLPMMLEDGLRVVGYTVEDPRECMGINNRVQLAAAEKILQRRINEHWMLRGVTMIDPDQTWISEDSSVGRDTVIYPGVHLEKGSSVGEDCVIGPNVRMQAAQVEHHCQVEQSVLQQAHVCSYASIGPFANLRPGAVIGESCRIGDFVEGKNSTIGANTSAAHHTYLGDAEIGADVNIGCGTITCNYDGIKKTKTIIEDGAFIGSNSCLVAPVCIGRGAYVAAGSTITEDVPADSLGIARGRQTNKEGWTKRRFQGDSR